MKKLLILLPAIALFVSPWMHKLIVWNLQFANPSISDEGAHVLAITMSLVAVLATAGLCEKVLGR